MSWAEIWQWLRANVHPRWDMHSVKFVVMTVIAISMATWRFIKYFGSSGWPVVNGKVESAYSATETNDGVEGMGAEVAYSYEVEGEYFSGFYFKKFLREREADEYAARFKKGQMLPVHYDPRHPERSKVMEGEAEWATVGVAGAPQSEVVG
jgi:hypothetical protein